MQLADCSPAAPPGDRAAHVFSGQNQTAYLRLKLALSLSLRRQIFLAVCDDLSLRNRLAARLYAELAYPSAKPFVAAKPLVPEAGRSSLRQKGAAGIVAPVADHPLVMTDDRAVVSTSPQAAARLLYPRLVSLNLNLSDPNPMAQIAAWLAEYPPPPAQSRSRSPGFQILGIERLTRQSAPVQKRFLHSLQQIEHYLPCLESPLLLWLPRPWLNAVQQSAPIFWQWHTALFAFEGDPTPVRSVAVRLDPQRSERLQHPNVTNETVVPATADPPVVDLPIVDPLIVAPSQAAIAEPNAPPAHPVSSHTAAPTPKENLWDILSHDLALLDGSKQTASPPLERLEPPDRTPVALPTIAFVDSSTPIADPTVYPAHQTDAQTDETATPLYVSPASVRSSVPTAATRPAPAAPPLLTIEDHTIEDQTIEDHTIAVDRRDPDSAEQRQAALAMADLILAVVAEEAGEASSSQNASSQNASIIQSLQQIEQLHLQQAPKATLLAAYQNLGNLCRDRIEQGNASTQHLLLTVCVYEQTLPWLDADSLLWSDVLNDIGNLFWMLSQQESAVAESLTYLDQAIAAYQQALAKTNPETRPHNYAMIQNNIGSAYGDMARFRTPAESLQQSVTAYELALRYRPLHDDPSRYAATQNNLGTAYWNLAQHQQPVRRLKQAIAAYFESLRYYSPTREPMHYAMIQNNLGTAYWNLAQQPQADLGVGTAQGKPLTAADLLQRAIAAYRAALIYRTLDTTPAAYAATQNNLGTAYWQLASLLDSQPDQRHDRLQQAIVAYKAAIAAVDALTTASAPPALSFDPAATHNNLGLAHYQLATDKHSPTASAQRSASLEAALHHHLHALQSWQTQPELYQTVLSYVVQTLRAVHNEFGSKGQNLALSQVPAKLLPEVLKQL